MDIFEYFDPESLEDDVKLKIRTLLDNLEELKTLDEKVYYKFILFLCRLKNRTSDSGTQYEVFEEEIQKVDKTENITSWGNDVVNEVKAIAEESVTQSGFIFDRQSGSYYNEEQQCFYIPDYKLYYYHQTGAYYYYDEESQSLKFYSKVDLQEQDKYKPTIKAEPVIQRTIKADPVIQRTIKKDPKKTESEKEDGECSDSEDFLEEIKLLKSAVIESAPIFKEVQPAVIESAPKPKEVRPDWNKHVAPSLRFVVKNTEVKNLSVGKLFVLTQLGGTLGREGKHEVLIPDKSVSKLHLRFYYSFENGQFGYRIVDLGSRNGTFIDGVRLSESMTKSSPTCLTHGNILTIGCTDLLCHIHENDKTCIECDPNAKRTFRSIKEQHQFEQNQIKKKFGLTKGPKYKADNKYEDRSENRRKIEGSSHSSEKTQVASLDTAIDGKNKGFKLLEKMGWKEGKTLGKDETQGLLEPILITQRGKRGLGAAEEIDLESFEKTKKGRLKEDILNKTRKRYYKEPNDLEPG